MLDENYRSATEIIKASNNLIKHNSSSFFFNLKGNKKEKGLIIVKSFKSLDKQSDFIIQKIRELLNEGFKQENINYNI